MTFQRGEVYFVDLGPTIGREQSGRRPVVIVSNDNLNRQPLVVTVVPGTKSAKAPAAYLANVLAPAGMGGLTTDTVFLCFQVRALDHSRFRDPAVGVLPAQIMRQIEAALT